ncbi:integrin beta-1-binding protein 1 isoform X1 [Takifugu flavidus]|uniref:integrin beta-1-binding protein 1 isoform X1 n=1 Tax=Takifugu flavidus TaxID=433684 RepID=UPI002544B761|nr:integrin beta-1-binding protein 1 isoform X1 [Takifugu flavidus]XP_056914196.1 integrin beta-1-binding protein 1 isoform X1 [Takifugu flavidus]
MFRKVKKRHSSSSSQSSEISTKSKSVDSSLGGLSRSSTVASLDTDSTKSSGQFPLVPHHLNASFSYLFIHLVTVGNNSSEACAEFRVRYVGAIEKLEFNMSKTLQEPLDLIGYIDAAQQDGKLPFVPGDREMILGVSKYGVKVASLDQCDVLHRHPLYLIVRMLCYDDGLGAGKNLLALKTTDAQQEGCSIWVYQCSSSEQAQSICKVLSASFDCALSLDKS